MRHLNLDSILGVACLVLAVVPASADVLTVNSILAAKKAGAPVDGMIAMINDPANTVGMSAGDLATFRETGVSEKVIAAVLKVMDAMRTYFPQLPYAPPEN